MTEETKNTVRRRSGYTSVPNAAMSDTRLSIGSRGLLALLMTFSEGWVFRVSHIQKQCDVGREKYYKMINELKDAGYLAITKTKGPSGKFDGADWEIIDEPCAENPTSVKPESGKPDHIRENNSVRENNNKNPHTPKGDDLFGDDLPQSEEDQASAYEQMIDEGFNEWWGTIWPSHPRKAGKVDCAKLYRKICIGKFDKADQITPQQLNRATKAYIASVEDRQYLKAPLPWLRKPGFEPFLGTDPEPPLDPQRQRYREIAAQAAKHSEPAE